MSIKTENTIKSKLCIKCKAPDSYKFIKEIDKTMVYECQNCKRVIMKLK